MRKILFICKYLSTNKNGFESRLSVLINLFKAQTKKPKSVLLVHVKEVYLHCAKALMRSKIWRNEAQISRDQLPSMSQMIKDQTKSCMPLETQDEMKLRYKDTLY